MKKILIAMLFLLCGSLAIADASDVWYPEDGTWRNPSAPGRNFKIDVQDTTLILNVFGYKKNGSSVWYQAAEGWSETGGNKVFRATLNEFKDGQCIGCSYTKPVIKGPNGGNIVITFTSPSKARVSWEGDVFNIERSNVVVGAPPKLMLGTWTMVYQIIGSFSDIMKIVGIADPSDNEGATGIFFGTTDYGDLVVGECYKNAPNNNLNNKCLLGIADKDTDEIKDIFIVSPSINQARGVWLSQTSGREYPAWMSRIAGRRDTLFKPSSTVSAASHSVQSAKVDKRERQIAALEELSSSMPVDPQMLPEVIERIKNMLARTRQ